MKLKYDCLYVKSSKQFVVAKPAPASWGPAELSSMFEIKQEDLTVEELQAKNADRIAKAQADVEKAIAENKNRKPIKAVN